MKVLAWWSKRGTSVAVALAAAQLLAACSSPVPDLGDSGVPALTIDGGAPCDAGTTLCLGACVDFQSDGHHCGGCGHDCSYSFWPPTCRAGRCVDVCPANAPCARPGASCHVWRTHCHGEFPSSCDETTEPAPAGSPCDGGAGCDGGTCS